MRTAELCPQPAATTGRHMMMRSKRSWADLAVAAAAAVLVVFLAGIGGATAERIAREVPDSAEDRDETGMIDVYFKNELPEPVMVYFEGQDQRYPQGDGPIAPFVSSFRCCFLSCCLHDAPCYASAAGAMNA